MKKASFYVNFFYLIIKQLENIFKIFYFFLVKKGHIFKIFYFLEKVFYVKIDMKLPHELDPPYNIRRLYPPAKTLS